MLATYLFTASLHHSQQSQEKKSGDACRLIGLLEVHVNTFCFLVVDCPLLPWKLEGIILRRCSWASLLWFKSFF